MPDLHKLPISDRPPESSWARAVLFFVVFNIGCLCINGTQFLCLPLLLVSRDLYRGCINYTKKSFGTLLVLMCEWFAPTKFVITTEGIDESTFVRDRDGRVISMKFPDKLVMMANHQAYLDWWYLWAFTYYMNAPYSLFIITKKSLKWLPIIGWGMQFFDFIFLARSWSADRLPLGNHLKRIGTLTQANQDPLTLLIFPEGTLVSNDTRPLSKKYADKMGIEDMTNCLLPRSTGLLFALRSLVPYVPSLHLLDVTVGYPGIPPAGYGQYYYTLRSVFYQGVPPPELHVHLRLYQVRHDVPIGNVGEAGDGNVGRGAEANEEERKAFDEWLTRRWREKDALLETFYRDGRFWSGKAKPVESSATTNGDSHIMGGSDAVEIPLEVRTWQDIPHAFGFFAPGIAYYAFTRVRRAILGH
ncbi:hypothetical protein FRB99_003447 [Tulasnella sp. 403]|nr:hypothetical protein FRB99_003447 [Tulasnella sp. 403]